MTRKDTSKLISEREPWSNEKMMNDTEEWQVDAEKCFCLFFFFFTYSFEPALQRLSGLVWRTQLYLGGDIRDPLNHTAST